MGAGSDRGKAGEIMIESRKFHPPFLCIGSAPNFRLSIGSLRFPSLAGRRLIGRGARTIPSLIGRSRGTRRVSLLAEMESRWTARQANVVCSYATRA